MEPNLNRAGLYVGETSSQHARGMAALHGVGIVDVKNTALEGYRAFESLKPEYVFIENNIRYSRHGQLHPNHSKGLAAHIMETSPETTVIRVNSS